MARPKTKRARAARSVRAAQKALARATYADTKAKLEASIAAANAKGDQKAVAKLRLDLANAKLAAASVK